MAVPEGLDREQFWLNEVWKAFGCAPNPDAFKASVRDSMWAQVVEWASERERENRVSYEHGRAAGYQQGREASTTD